MSRGVRGLERLHKLRWARHGRPGGLSSVLSRAKHVAERAKPALRLLARACTTAKERQEWSWFFTRLAARLDKQCKQPRRKKSSPKVAPRGPQGISVPPSVSEESEESEEAVHVPKKEALVQNRRARGEAEVTQPYAESPGRKEREVVVAPPRQADSSAAGRGLIVLPVSTKVAAALDEELAEKRPDEVLCTRFGAAITRRHLACLLPESWLNDEVVNCYFRLLQEQSQGSLWCPSSFFWPRLLVEGHPGVQRWARRASVVVSSLRAILFPLNLDDTHWALGAVDFEQRCFRYMDSLGLSPPPALEKRLREYLEGEGCRLGRSWALVPAAASLPQQRNTSDCGVFTCAYAERLAAGAPVEFGTSTGAVHKMRFALAGAILRGCL